MKYCIIVIVLLLAVNQILADDMESVSGDTISFTANSKLYDGALISGLRQNTQLQLLKNSGFESYYSLFGIPYSINFSLDGVELNSILDGGINLMNFNGSYFTKPKIKPSSGFNPVSTIELISDIPQKSGFNAYTHFGNNKLLANLEANYRKNNYFLLAHANYNNHNAYKVSEMANLSSIDSTNRLLNSEFEGKSVFVKTGIIEDYSELIAEYLHINNSRNIPLNYLASDPEYLKENQYKMNMMSIIYKSRMTNNASLRGNFYYRDNKRILDSYDDATYSTQQSDQSYRNLTKEQIIGFDFSTILNYKKMGQSEIGALYKRMQLYEKANYGLKAFEYIPEILGLEWSQFIPIGEKIAVSTKIAYKYINPVYPYNNGLANKSILEYNAEIKQKISENFQYSIFYSKNGAFPYIKYIYSKNAPILENNLCDIGLVKTDFKLFGISIQANAFYTNFSNYFKNLGELMRLSGNTAGGGLIVHKNFRYMNINLSYTYLNQLEPNNLFPQFSKNNFYISLGKEYEMGLKWLIENRIFTEQSAKHNTTKLLDFWVQQKIINHINVFVYADNILNEYYELYPGYPAQGINFCFGINVEI
jgi:hypothetical protein